MLQRIISLLAVLSLLFFLPISTKAHGQELEIPEKAYGNIEFDAPEEAKDLASYANTKKALQEHAYWDEETDQMIYMTEQELKEKHGDFMGEYIFLLMESNRTAAERVVNEKIAKIEKPKTESTTETETISEVTIEANIDEPAEPSQMVEKDIVIMFAVIVSLLLVAVIWLLVINSKMSRRLNKAPDRWKGPDLD